MLGAGCWELGVGTSATLWLTRMPPRALRLLPRPPNIRLRILLLLGGPKQPICQCNAKCNSEQINWKHNCLSLFPSRRLPLSDPPSWPHNFPPPLYPQPVCPVEQWSWDLFCIDRKFQYSFAVVAQLLYTSHSLLFNCSPGHSGSKALETLEEIQVPSNSLVAVMHMADLI